MMMRCVLAVYRRKLFDAINAAGGRVCWINWLCGGTGGSLGMVAL